LNFNTLFRQSQQQNSIYIIDSFDKVHLEIKCIEGWCFQGVKQKRNRSYETEGIPDYGILLFLLVRKKPSLHE